MAEIDHGRFDYIIVGAGSAGCVLANRLTQNPDVTVLLLEAGAKDDYHWIHIPVGYLYCINNPRTDWQFKTEALPGLNGRSLLYPRGRVLGGSSSINGMIYMRGQDQNYAEWARLTNDNAWNWERCLERFKQFEDYHGDVNQWHGNGSEWTVSQQRLRWEILEVFKDAAIEAGIPQTNDFNRGNNWGVGYFDVNQRNGLRLNASKAFLKKASGRPNLTIITGALVKKLQVDSSTRTCSAISFLAGDQQHVASVGHEALLCAGAIGSVQILERSGIGQGPLLQNMGIPVVSHLPGVGENLQDHLQLRMVYQVTGIKTLNTQIRSLFGKVQIGLQYLLNRSGPMSMAPSQLGAFAFSSAHYQLPNLQYHVQPLSLDKFGEDLHSFNAFTASVCNLQPSSRGSVHIVSANTHTPPRIDPNYLATAEDQQVALDAMRLTRKIVSQPSLKPYCPVEYKPGAHLVNDVELRHAAGEIGTTIFHPVGTCKMGSLSDPLAVLDSQMRVIGVKGLRVVDASAMPTITSGNTAAPTMMIAIRAAELLMS
ncbi:MAG: GMC family oxidoreductase N-terminal domain-containing protein [Polynucleobacter sp.]|jgi:choline dehydrogenase|nr:GMC family oxidoreductase N-terminal domain-containing protein [Polynucleobacter sp.]